MVNQLYDAIQKGIDVRQNLIELKKQIKDDNQKRALAYRLGGEFQTLTSLLAHEDPKVRKNAALVLGELEWDDLLEVLTEAYEKEDQLFVKSSYLKAIQNYDYEKYLNRFKKRMQQLLHADTQMQENKHAIEEVAALREMILKYEKPEQHKFIGYNERTEFLLMTNKLHKDVTAREIKRASVKEFGGGLRVLTDHLDDILEIRTFREILFIIPGLPAVSPDPIQAAEQIAKSDLQSFLTKMHSGDSPYYFRMEINSRMDLEKRSRFVKRLAGELEILTKGALMNSSSNYEIEIRLVESKDGRFHTFLKLFTIPDKRFRYRKEVVAASLNPVTAALTAAIAKPYLKEYAQVLDPFCGVGTMLLERNLAVKARNMYGIDIFGEAVLKARKNAEACNVLINFINRDFFTFEHDYAFDEIFTNMPARSKSVTKAELDDLYGAFFNKSQELLKKGGVMILHSNESGLIKKWVRLTPGWKIEKEALLDERSGSTVFVLTY